MNEEHAESVMQKHRDNAKAKNQKRKKNGEETTETTETWSKEIDTFQNEMESVLLLDRSSNEKNKPAFLRLKMLPRIENMLL